MKKEEVRLILCILISMGMCLLLVFCGQHIKRAELTARAMENAGMENGEDDEETEATEIKKIALTFDDDVIIGLSQEISYKEAVSMI